MSANSFADAEPEPSAPLPAEPGLVASLPAFLAGFLGTLVGAALFPPAWLAIVRLSQVGNGQPATNRDWAGAAVFYIALWIGMGTWAVAYTALEAVFIFPFVAAIHALVGSYRRRVAFVSVAGGCTGMAAAIFWMEGAGLVDVVAATLWGQFYAAGAAGLLAARRHAELQTPQRSTWQFSLRQMLGFATAAALILTVLVNVPLPPTTRLLIACGLAVQLLALGAFYAAAALLKRVSRST